MAPTPDNPGLLNWVLILLAGLMWGTAFLSMEIALDGFGPVTVAALRVALGAPVLILGGALIGQGLDKLGSARAWAFAAALGVLSYSGPFFLLSWGLQHVTSAFAGIAMGTVPLFLIPLTLIFSRDEGVTPLKVLGLLFGFGGLVILVSGGSGAEGGGGPQERLGQAACIGTAICYAIGSIVTRRSPPVPPIAFAGAALLVASLVMVPAALLVEGLPAALPPGPFAAVAWAAVVPTALAAFLRVHIIRQAGLLFMSLVAYMVPVWAVIFGVTLMGEDLPPTLFAGFGLILGGIAIGQWPSFAALGRSLRRSR